MGRKIAREDPSRGTLAHLVAAVERLKLAREEVENSIQVRNNIIRFEYSRGTNTAHIVELAKISRVTLYKIVGDLVVRDQVAGDSGSE